MSPPRSKLRCLDQGPQIRLRDPNKKSTGGRPPRKLLATGARRSLIQRPSRHELYIMKRREAYLLAAKEALEQEEVKIPKVNRGNTLNEDTEELDYEKIFNGTVIEKLRIAGNSR